MSDSYRDMDERRISNLEAAFELALKRIDALESHCTSLEHRLRACERATPLDRPPSRKLPPTKR